MRRKMQFANMFYPSKRLDVENIIKDVEKKIEKKEYLDVCGAILPHAGWLFSGETALKALFSIKNPKKYKRVIIFGTVHTYGVFEPTIFDEGSWETPLGELKVDNKYIKEKNFEKYFEVAPQKHNDEHSIEVLLPFIKYLMPDIKIVPISIPVISKEKLEELKVFFEELSQDENLYIVSSDFTHYGVNYGFLPKGTGKEAYRWVVEEKDKAFIELIEEKKYYEIIPYSQKHLSACGAPAIALMTSFLSECDIQVIDYSASCDKYVQGGYDSFVTYCGIVYKRRER